MRIAACGPHSAQARGCSLAPLKHLVPPASEIVKPRQTRVSRSERLPGDTGKRRPHCAAGPVPEPTHTSRGTVPPSTTVAAEWPRPWSRPTRSQMSGEVCVHTWPCSYYLELDKRWVPGKLSLTSCSLKFAADEAQETLVSFPLSGITAIKKEASHFVFSSITVLEKDNRKHWFGSLQPSRNAAFSVIEHFWRELLLSQPEAPLPATKGKELTGLMACSQKRLEDTARVLHHQGEQLDSITRGLNKMESDLDVADSSLLLHGHADLCVLGFSGEPCAERTWVCVPAQERSLLPSPAPSSPPALQLNHMQAGQAPCRQLPPDTRLRPPACGVRLLTELESPSWWPFSSKLWKMPSETKLKGDASTASPKTLGKEGVVVRIPAVVSQRTASHVKPGSLTVLVSGLEIHDSSSALMHRFEREDVDDIKVHTPYEISIRQRFIGKPDIAYHLISARMPEAIPVLEVQFSKKMEVLGDALTPSSTKTSSPAEKGCSMWHTDPEETQRSCPGHRGRAGEAGRGPG
uniref:synaptosomal-associated protein 47 isoform X4 n=1 Tax=Panthera onca TaxID=9690 RepID=UPI0029531336|nr:synaptosomal-associated protein 47 isoform X4 [Panthera onca]